MPAPLAAGGRDDIRMVGQPRPLRAEERIYVEPLEARDIGRRLLDVEAGRPIAMQNERAPAQPMPMRRETKIYEDHYRAAPMPRMPNWGGGGGGPNNHGGPC